MKYNVNANEFCPDDCPYCEIETQSYGGVVYGTKYMPIYVETNCAHKRRCENAYKLREKQEKENYAKIVESLFDAHLITCGGCPAKPICDMDENGIKSCKEHLQNWIESIINEEAENE